MKLLHIADLHIGKTVNGFSLLDDQRHALGQVLDIALRENVDAILLAGDLYDKSMPSAEAVALVDWLLYRIAELGVSCFVIPGNHDSAERVAYAAGPLARQGIHVAPLFDGTMEPVRLEDEHGTVAIWLLPFLKPASARRFFPDDPIGTDYTAATRAVLDRCSIDTAERNVLLCHQFVTAGGAEPERSDSELSVGGLDNVDASVFDRFDYVALGHIHRPQRIGCDTVRYAGSLLKYSASEADHVKSAALVTLGAKPAGAKCSIAIDLVPIEPLHDMRRIKGPLADLVRPDVSAAAGREDYLHVTLTDKTPAIDALARLRAIYPNVMSLEYERPRAASSSDERCDADAIEKIDPADLFARFFEERTGTTLSGKQRRIADQALRAQMERSAEEAGNVPVDESAVAEGDRR